MRLAITPRRPHPWTPFLALSGLALKAVLVLAPLAAGAVLLLRAAAGG